MAYVLLFFSRRYLMVLIITALPLYRNTQIQGQLWTTLFMMAYSTYVRPFKLGHNNFQETVNEIITLLAVYPLFVFTEWVYDQ